MQFYIYLIKFSCIFFSTEYSSILIKNKPILIQTNLETNLSQFKKLFYKWIMKVKRKNEFYIYPINVPCESCALKYFQDLIKNKPNLIQTEWKTNLSQFREIWIFTFP